MSKHIYKAELHELEREYYALQRKYDHLLEIAEEWGSYLADDEGRLDFAGKEWIDRLKTHAPHFDNLIGTQTDDEEGDDDYEE
jgi:hypothetical protein